jgi:hypothetical protein
MHALAMPGSPVTPRYGDVDAGLIDKLQSR